MKAAGGRQMKWEAVTTPTAGTIFKRPISVVRGAMREPGSLSSINECDGSCADSNVRKGAVKGDTMSATRANAHAFFNIFPCPFGS